MAILNAVTESLQQKVARLEAENLALKSRPANKLSFKVSAKGCVSVLGLQRFPVTLYASQWERLAAIMPELQSFIQANAAALARKEVIAA